MNSSLSLSLLFAVPIVLGFLGLLAAAVYALVMRSKSRRASNFVLAGLLMKLASYFISVFFNFVLAQTFAASEIPFFIGCGAIVTTLIDLLGLGLIVAAVFIDRGGSSSNDDRSKSSSEPIDNEALRNPEDDSNPFRTPIAN